MRRFFGATVLAQVGLLAASAVIASQLVTAALIVFAPSPRPPGFTIDAAVAALEGLPAHTSDGRRLHREIHRDAPFEDDHGPFGNDVTMAVSRRLSIDTDDVRVRMTRRGPGEPRRNGPSPGDRPPFRSDRPPLPRRAAAEIDPISNQVTLPPMEIAVRKADEWILVRAPRSLLSPWQASLLLSMAISLVLLAPLIWWMARRLSAPIHRFAQAADSFGADPDSPPLPEEGPTEVRVAIAAFNEMQARLRDHIRRRTQTVAAIAHDIRTPLTRLRFRVEQAPTAQRDAMAADVDEIDTLIGDALAFARDDATKDNAVRVDLANVARSLVDRYRATDAKVVLICDESPVWISAEPSLLRRGIANLIDNGLTYGGAVEVRLRASNGQAELRISDRGPGIPEAHLTDVFEPFFRLEGSRNRRTGGAGLGLAVARQAARRSFGEVTLSNRPGGGLDAVLVMPTSSAHRQD